MPDPDTASYNFEDLADITDKYKISVSKGDAAIDVATYALMLDSSTVLKLFFTTKGDFEGTPMVSVQGGEAFAAEKSDGRYVITIDDLSAHKLADMNEVSITAGGEYKVRVSALSYANYVLTSSEDNDVRNAMASLYRY